MTHPILRKLEGGDRRSLGRAKEVVDEVLRSPNLFDILMPALLAEDPVLRMRVADVVEKASRARPECLHPYKALLINAAAHIDQAEVRWHLAQMLPRLPWSEAERQRVMALLMTYFNDRSSIVKACAMQALAEFALQEPALRPSVLLHLRELTVIGTPAMKARGRKLLKLLES